jgi:hypothetical protein
MTAGSSLLNAQSESAVTRECWGIPYSESPPLSYSENYPSRPHSPTSRTRTSSALNSGSVMNSAVFNTSGSIVQGGNVSNMAVEFHAPDVSTAAPDGHNTNIAQTPIVIDDDDYEETGSGRYNNPIQLEHVQF